MGLVTYWEFSGCSLFVVLGVLEDNNTYFECRVLVLGFHVLVFVLGNEVLVMTLVCYATHRVK